MNFYFRETQFNPILKNPNKEFCIHFNSLLKRSCLTKFMGKKGGAKNHPKSEPGSHNHPPNPISLREEATGKIKTKPATNTKSNLRIDHLKKLAVWATTDSCIPSLGAFYGQHLATLAEATGVPPDSSLITCQRCETVLHPGFNSTTRIEKNRSRVRHRHKQSVGIVQNNIVYKCHFCSHQNLKRGTPKGHIKKICPSNKLSLESTPTTKDITHESSKVEKGIVSKNDANEIHAFASQVVDKEVTLLDNLTTPPSTSTPTLLEGKKRRRNNSTSNKANETPMSARVEAAKTQSTSIKRRRKSWTSLKEEISQRKEHDISQVANLTIPFFL